MKMWKSRLFSRIYAALNGLFWLPCPICGECFGAHEGGNYGVPISHDPLHCRIACCKPECQLKAREITEDLQEWADRKVTEPASKAP